MPTIPPIIFFIFYSLVIYLYLSSLQLQTNSPLSYFLLIFLCLHIIHAYQVYVLLHLRFFIKTFYISNKYLAGYRFLLIPVVLISPIYAIYYNPFDLVVFYYPPLSIFINFFIFLFPKISCPRCISRHPLPPIFYLNIYPLLFENLTPLPLSCIPINTYSCHLSWQRLLHFYSTFPPPRNLFLPLYIYFFCHLPIFFIVIVISCLRSIQYYLLYISDLFLHCPLYLNHGYLCTRVFCRGVFFTSLPSYIII